MPVEAGACVWRERHDGGPIPCTPLNNGVSLPRQTTLPPGAFLAVELLTPVPSGCLRAAELLTPILSGGFHMVNSHPLPRSTLLTPHFSTQPPTALVDIHLSLGHTVLWHRQSVQVLLCPTCHRLATAPSSDSPQSPPQFQKISLPVRGPSWCCNFSFPSAHPQGCRSHSISSFLFLPFLSFILTGYGGIIFLVLLGV